MKKLLLILLSALSCPFIIYSQEKEVIQGEVYSAIDSLPLAGASVIVKGTTHGVITDSEGTFKISVKGESTLVISYIGFISEERQVDPLNAGPLYIQLVEDHLLLGDVEIVSTGYEEIPAERRTGSFEHLDTQLINRSTGPGIIDRLEGITSGLDFQRVGSDYSSTSLQIRGRSTLFAEEQPLIIVDNFPYDGALDLINPNDVESVTVLKDAAAASIWGARAGNGVIVITTKQGKENQLPKVTLNSNMTFGEKRDAFYSPYMNVSDYIDTEITLFNNGYYTSDETARDHRALSPVVELLIEGRDGTKTPEEVGNYIANLRQYDVREDIDKYLYRPTWQQQHAVTIQGGSNRQQYYMSLGYDQQRGTVEGEEGRRITVDIKNSWMFLKDRLKVSSDLYYVQNHEGRAPINPHGLVADYSTMPPYSRLANDQGEPLPVIKDFRNGFIESSEAAGLLDWQYYPLREARIVEQRVKQVDYRANLGINYKLLEGLQLSARYQYWQGQTDGHDLYPEESYFSRDLINRYTQSEENVLSYPIPVGGILDVDQSEGHSHNFRGQVQFSRLYHFKHQINALGGYEIRERVMQGYSTRYYGYDDETGVSEPVDYDTRYYQYYYASRRNTIPDNDSHTLLTDRFISWYGNTSYLYDQRYMISLSLRKDQSNLFGVDANQRGVPLWSAGIGWFAHRSLDLPWLPFLKLRTTYGASGNIDKSITALTTARFLGNSFNTGLLYAGITNPPNPELSWEKVHMFNIGLDFSLKRDRLEGSIEFYSKKSRDLIGYKPVSPATGQTQFKGNVASLSGHGWDITLHSKNLLEPVLWETNFLLSNTHSEVGSYKAEPAVYQLVQYADISTYPVEGNAPLGIYSYRWAGLDPDTGNPQGYLNGEISQDYSAIINNLAPDSLIYHGSALPTTFGGLRNSLTWKHLSLSFNITYRFGYYFRRESIQYGYDLGLSSAHGDYSRRWQQPGDETNTQVPSIPEKGDSYRDNFYRYSSVLVEKGDNIRLQDISLSYAFDRNNFPVLPFNRLELYAYARNLGILWKASDQVDDPDYRRVNIPKSFSMGLKINF